MKIFDYNGIDVRIQSRDHCPPHVHVAGPEWQARFVFSFVNNGVKLWDIQVGTKTPKAKELEAVRQRLLQRDHLQQARKRWSIAMAELKLCLANQAWDDESDNVVEPSGHRSAVKILDATYDALRNVTRLELADQPFEVEIQL